MKGVRKTRTMHTLVFIAFARRLLRAAEVEEMSTPMPLSHRDAPLGMQFIFRPESRA